MAERVWLVTGGRGQVGAALATSPPTGVRIVAPPRTVLDLALGDALDVEPLIEAECVTAIINCAAYTRVDQAEDEPELALRINGGAVGALSRASQRADVPLVQISTDYVFSGDKLLPYDEEDQPAPRSSYGRSKLAGEIATAAHSPRHAILRTAWVFDASRKNFLTTMLRLGRERSEVGVVGDQRGSPTYAGDLAAAIAKVTMDLEDKRCGSGIWHVVNSGDASWHAFAECIFKRAAAHGHSVPKLSRLRTDEFPTKATRPANSRLSTHKILRDFDLALRNWREAVNEVVDTLVRRDGAVI